METKVFFQRKNALLSLETKPLSNIEITNKLEKYGINIKFIPYQDIKNVKKIDDLLPCILLYQLHYPVGHWVCLFKNQEGINYFDSTGNFPDELLKTNFDNIQGRKKLNADYTYLADLMFKNGEKIIYNEIELQPENTMWCGHISFMRLMTQNVLNDEFNKILSQYDDNERGRKVVEFWNKF